MQTFLTQFGSQVFGRACRFRAYRACPVIILTCNTRSVLSKHDRPPEQSRLQMEQARKRGTNQQTSRSERHRQLCDRCSHPSRPRRQPTISHTLHGSAAVRTNGGSHRYELSAIRTRPEIRIGHRESAGPSRGKQQHQSSHKGPDEADHSEDHENGYWHGLDLLPFLDLETRVLGHSLGGIAGPAMVPTAISEQAAINLRVLRFTVDFAVAELACCSDAPATDLRSQTHASCQVGSVSCDHVHSLGPPVRPPVNRRSAAHYDTPAIARSHAVADSRTTDAGQCVDKEDGLAANVEVRSRDIRRLAVTRSVVRQLSHSTTRRLIRPFQQRKGGQIEHVYRLGHRRGCTRFLLIRCRRLFNDERTTTQEGHDPCTSQDVQSPTTNAAAHDNVLRRRRGQVPVPEAGRRRIPHRPTSHTMQPP